MRLDETRERQGDFQQSFSPEIARRKGKRMQRHTALQIYPVFLIGLEDWQSLDQIE